AAKGGVPGVELLIFSLARDDQPLGEGARDKGSFELRGEIAASAARAVLLHVGEIIPVRRAEQGAGDLRAPRRGVVSGRGPDPPSGQAIAAAVERVRMGAGEQVKAVELVSSGEGKRGGTDLDIGPRVPRPAHPAREVAVAVLVTWP